MKNQDLIALFGGLGGNQSDFSNPYSTKGIVDSFSNTPVYTGQVLSPLDNKPTPYEIEQEKRRFERQGRVRNAYDDFMSIFGPSTYQANKEYQFKKEYENAKDMTVEDLQKQRLQQQLEKNKQMGGGPVNRDDLSTETLQEKLSLTPDLKELREIEEEIEDGNDKDNKDDNNNVDDTNWFDRLNEKVDLMAMGAAMLAGSSSGKGTAANIGQALQTGIASRRKEELQDEAKKRADALLAIQYLSAMNKGRLTNPQAVGALESELKVAGAEGDNVNTIANYLYNNPQMNYNMSLLDPTQRQAFIDKFVSEGQGWMGDEIEMSNVIDAGTTALDFIKGK